MDEQDEVAAFLETHELHTNPEFRVLDLASEVGELAKDVNESSGYGSDSEAATVSTGELGDTLFCVLAFADEAGIDAGEALEDALAKYENRLSSTGSAGSDNPDM